MTSTMELKTTPSNPVGNENDQSSTSTLKLKRDIIDVYTTMPIYFLEDTEKLFDGTNLIIRYDVQENICNGALCCEFSLKVKKVYSMEKPTISRGDDYSLMNFRMAVFDGVRTYGHFATGGVQTCAIIPCIRSDLASCGLRADDPAAEPNSLLGYYQTAFIFESVYIKAVFSNIDSFIGPTVLLGGEGDSFGSLLEPDGFTFSTRKVNKSSVEKSLKTTRPIHNLVTMSLYGRLFDRDGMPHTGSSDGSTS